MQDFYPNLPGILTEFKDGGLQLRSDPNPPATESILLLGTAVDGPRGVPVAVDAETVELVFGKAVNSAGIYNGATLVVGFEEAWRAGCRDIRCMRISGEPARAAIQCEPITEVQEQLFTEELGVAAGNTQCSFVLQHDPLTGTVQVSANGVSLPTSAFTVDYLTRTVTLQADVCSSGDPIAITYSYDDAGDTVVVTESSDANGPWEAAGTDQVFTLSQTQVIADTVVLLIGGVTAVPDAYTVVGNTLTVHPGYATKGVLLSVRYIAVVEQTIANVEIHAATINAGQLYNDSAYSVEDYVVNGQVVGKILKLEKPPVKKLSSQEQPLTYSSIQYPTLGMLVQAVNSDPNNGIFRLTIDKQFENESSMNLKTKARTNFTGGDDGLNLTKRKMYELLGGKRDALGRLVEDGAYQLLENYTVDWIVPLGVYADDELPDPKQNFAQQLAMACAVISLRQHTTYGVIATKSPNDITLLDIQNHVNALLARKNDYFVLDPDGNPILDKEGKKFDIGQYIHVVAGPDLQLQNTRLGTYYANSAAVFAAMMTTRSAGDSPLNKTVPGVLGLRYTYGNTQRNLLTAARYVTYKTKNNGAVVAVEDSMTCAQPGSDYARTTTLRAVKKAVDIVRDACDPYLGKPNNAVNQNAMSTAIDKGLSAMKEAGDINDYRFNILATRAEQLLGKARIELTIVPPFELRSITVVVSLTPSL